MPIRVLHVVDTWAVGGLQNGLANLIARLDGDEFEHVICAIRSVDERSAPQIPPARTRVISLTKEESASRFQAPALTRRIREQKPDIVHTRNWGAFEGLLAARRVGKCARVHSEHGIDTDAKEPWRRTVCRRLAFELADRVLSVSRQLKELHARATRFPAHKIEVIHNGVDSRLFRPDAEVRVRVRRKLGIADDELCVGCVGSLTPVKDHGALFRAMSRLAESGRRWRLLVAGDGPERAKLEAFAARNFASKNLAVFLGGSSAVAEMLNALDVYVLPSLTEGISNSLLEAMATGLPVVATETGGTPEVIVDGQSGVLVPVGDDARLADCLAALAADVGRRRRLGEEALRRVRAEFSIDCMVRNYEQVYRACEGL